MTGLLLAPAGPAAAAVDLVLGASVGVEQNTNILERNTEAFFPGDIGPVEDMSTRVSANAAATVTGGPLQTALQARFTRVQFADIETMDHSDYNVGADVTWRLATLADIRLQATQSRGAVGLADIGGAQVAQQTSRQGEVTFRIRPTPRWQVGLAPGVQDLKLPQPASPDFKLRETSGTVTLDYLGAGKVVPGILVRETSGRFTGIENATRYDQTSFQGTLNYKVTEFSSFSLAAGYTERTTRLVVPSTDPSALGFEGSTPSVTGAINYQRRLSPKTSFNVGVFRDFQQFAAGVNTTVGTGVDAGVQWAPTLKLSVALGTRWNWSTIEELQVTSARRDREDLLRSYTMDVSYRAMRRASLRAYASHRVRDSTSRFALFDATTYGLELNATFD